MKASVSAYRELTPGVEAPALAPTPRSGELGNPQAVPAVSGRSLVRLLCDLTKARLTLLVLLTTLVGFLIGSTGPVQLLLLLHTIVGTALLASGASALNQLLERDLDALMHRTEDRPLPSGRMRPRTAMALGLAGAGLGLVYLALAVNLPTSLLGAVTVVAYLCIYTPLKRISTLNTVIGAVPGAMPPLMGWVAARGDLSAGGWALFAIQFFWQLPHFLAIAWLYREDYARAGFRMLPVVDPDGRQTGFQAVGHALGLLAVSLSPFVLRLAGGTYLVAALGCGTAFLLMAIRFARRLDRQSARGLFLASILYLPLLLGLMVWDKVR